MTEPRQHVAPAQNLGRDLRLALRLARRELRGSLSRFGVFLACLALGVAAVVAVGQVAAVVDASLRADAKAILGGDIAVTRSHLPLEQPALDWLQARGEVTHKVRLRTMARPVRAVEAEYDPALPQTRRSMLVELKAVEESYPLYGAATLQDGGDFHQALQRHDGVWGAVVDPRVLARLGLHTGDELLVGQARFRINAVLQHEPDKAAQFFGLGPRLFVAMDSLPDTGLIVPGTVVSHDYVLRVPQTQGGGYRAGSQDPGRAKALVEEFQAAFGDSGARVRDFTESGGSLRRFMENLERYLLLVGLIALLVGGIGVANGVRSYLETKSGAIATLKCLGAQRGMVLGVYLLQVLYLALLGSGLGLAAGLAAAWGATHFLFQVLGFAGDPGEAMLRGLGAAPLLAGLGFGLLTALLFALQPLDMACQVSPARLFRGYADPGRPATGRGTRLAALAVLVAMLLLAWLQTANLLLVAGFAGGVLAGALTFSLAARGIMRLAAMAPRSRRPWLRQALANLHRPGARTRDVVFSLGLGLSALAGVALIDGNMQHRISRQMPEQAPSYFFIDIPKDRIEEFRRTLESLPGVTDFQNEPSLRGRIVAVNDVPAEQWEVKPDAQWAVRGERGLTFAAAKPDKVRVTAGEWWPEDYAGPPVMCFTEDLADGFGIGVGDSLTLNILGRNITARIVCLREVEWGTLALNHAVMLGPGVLEAAPYSHLATVYSAPVESGGSDPVFDTVVTQFPEVTAVYIRDVLQDVAGIFDAIGLAVRATAGVTLLAGLLVLAETLRAGLRGRFYEAVIFKVLGATRRDIVRSLATEFLLQGAATALLAAVLGSLVSLAFIHFAIKGDWVFLPLPLLTVCLGGVLATLVLGLLGIRGILGRKAWPVLRNE